MNSNPSEHLLPSRSIEIEVEGGVAPMRTLVESEPVDGVFRVLAPFVDGHTFLFSGMSELNVIYSYKDSVGTKVAQLRCRILKKGIVDGLPVLTLQIAGTPQPTQRRRAFRVNVFSKIVAKTADGTICYFTTKDISVYGMFVYSDVKISVNESIRILWNFENDEAMIEDPAFLERAFYEATEEEGAEERDIKMLNLEKYSDEYLLQEQYEQEKKKYFVIKADVVSCTYDNETRNYAVRLNYDHIHDNYSKRILRFLYKKQAEILSTDPRVSERIDKFFSNEKGEEPLPFSISVFTLAASSLAGLAFILFMLSKPSGSTFMDSFFNISRVVSWNRMQLNLAIVVMGVSFGLEIISLSARINYALKKRYSFNLLDAMRPVGFLAFLIYILTIAAVNIW